MIKIRKAKGSDFEDIWNIFYQVVKNGDTFAFDPQAGKEDCKTLWMSPSIHTFVAELQNKTLGTYILKKISRVWALTWQMRLIWSIRRRAGKE